MRNMPTNIILFVAFLLPLHVSANSNTSFQQSVSNNFIQHTLAGQWHSDCIANGTENTATTLSYTFGSDGQVQLTSSSFSDTSCVTPIATSTTNGTVILSGLTIDKYGRYLHELTITTADGARLTLRASINHSDFITLIDSETQHSETPLSRN